MAAASRRSFGGMQELGLIIVVLLIAAFSSYVGYERAAPGQDNLFLNPDNLVNGVAASMSVFAIMAIGMTCVIITGGIDISVASIMALAAVGGAAAMQTLPPDAPAWQALGMGVGVPIIIGLLCGAFNALFIVGMRMHPFIVTLATLSIFRCFAIAYPYPEATLPSAGKRLPESFKAVMDYSVNDMRITPMIVMMLVVIAGAIYLGLMVAGRETYAVGGNETAARFSGIRVEWVKTRVYLISGFCGGVAAVVSLGRHGTVSTNSFTGDELGVVAAAVIGGASLAGGRGTALGALLGALIIALIENDINNFVDNKIYRLLIIGGAILLAVMVERMGPMLRARGILRQRGFEVQKAGGSS